MVQQKLFVNCLFLAMIGLLLAPISASNKIYFEGGPATLYELLYGPEPAPNISQTSPLRIQILQNIIAWMQQAEERGINLLNLPLIDREGVTICDLKILKQAGFKPIQDLGNLLPMILAEAKKRNIAISIPLDDLGYIVYNIRPYKEWIDSNKLDCQNIAGFIAELGEYAQNYQVELWINEQTFGPEYRQILSIACHKHRIRYLRYSGDWDGSSEVFCSEDYATYPINPEENQDDAQYLQHLVQWGSIHGRIGLSNLMFGIANACQKETGVLTVGGWGLQPGTQCNVAIYRAVQFAPIVYGFYPAYYSEAPYIHLQDAIFVKSFQYQRQLLPWLEKFGRKKDDHPKPIANLILDIPSNLEPKIKATVEEALFSSIEAITNAITSAGMELHVTMQTIVPNSQLYYIFTIGTSSTTIETSSAENRIYDISPTLLSLFPCNHPVFLQTALGLPFGPNWQKVAPYFGLPNEARTLSQDSQNPGESPIPKYITYGFPDSNLYSIHYKGFQMGFSDPAGAGQSSALHKLAKLDELAGGTQILVRGPEAQKSPALITRKGHYFFVNGNFIHISVSNLLANFMAEQPIFYRPSGVYLTTGIERSSLFSSQDTQIDIRLPQSLQSSIWHWQSNGTLYEKSPLQWQNQHLMGPVQKWELVIVAKSR